MEYEIIVTTRQDEPMVFWPEGREPRTTQSRAFGGMLRNLIGGWLSRMRASGSSAASLGASGHHAPE